MTETIYKSSEEVKRKERSVIPFKELQPGQSVFRYDREVKEASLRSLISTNNGKYDDKAFKVVHHKKEKCFEIACIMRMVLETDASIQIVESSDKAKKFEDGIIRGKCKFPFSEIPEGMSFILPIEGTNEKSLRVACSVNSKKLDKRFILLKHENYGMFEVYHKPKPEIKFFTPSPEILAKLYEGVEVSE